MNNNNNNNNNIYIYIITIIIIYIHLEDKKAPGDICKYIHEREYAYIYMYI